MRHPIRALVTALAFFALPIAASAVPITMTVEQGGVPGFSYSLVHSCANPSCMSGSNLGNISGSLSGDLVDGALLDLEGELYIGGSFDQTYVVTGMFDFTDGGAGGILSFAGLGDFLFANAELSGPANSFDGDFLYAWGGIPANGVLSVANGGYRLGMDLGAKVTPTVPEPTAALLFGLGAIVVSRRRLV